MLENLSERLQGIFSGLRSKGRLTEDDINAAMREIRLALLEADVNFKVVKNFVARTKERCLSAEVLDSLTPAQNVVKIVLDELTEADLARILTEPKNALVKQYRKMFAVDGVDLAFTEQSVNAIASTAITRGTGARGLRSIIEKTLEETMFELPGMDDVQQVIVDAASVRGEGLPKLVRGERRLVA